MTAPEAPSVTQADWDAAFAFERMVGGADTSLLSTCFARHRTAAGAEAKAREAELVEVLSNVVLAHDNCTGCEPSVSLLARYIDEARSTLTALTSKEPDA